MTRRTLGLAAASLLLAGPVTAYAQAPAGVPGKMPFDVPYGAPISLADAQKAIAASLAEAHKHNWKMAIAVVDPAGQLIAEATMDGTQYASIDIAQGKARTAAIFRRPSKLFSDLVNNNNAAVLSFLIERHAVASEGGFPIVIGGKLIGAIGASGGIATQDGVTAEAGLDAITGK
jgi:glc operon protein GlcG